MILSASLAAASVRIALVPLDALAQNHADLALASLSSEDGFEFLERVEIDRIRQEVLLGALRDWVPDPHLMQNTELFVILKNQDLLAFDAVTGVRLADVRAVTPDDVSQAVRAAVSKRQSLVANRLRKLSFLPLIPAHLSDAQEQVARQLLTELLRQLGNRPDLVVLERHHLLLILNEPGAAKNDLTKGLFAGAIVVKPVATPEPQHSFRLCLEFFTPDGQTSLGVDEAVFLAGGDQGAAGRRFLSQLTLPAGDYDNRADEARSFIYEAWFAVKHLIPGQSLPAAASAVALDGAHEQELCRIAALNATSLWHWHSIHRTERTAAALASLQLAERLAVKHDIFPSELVYAIRDGVGMISPRAFAALDESQQRDVRATINRLLALRRGSLDECLRLADLPGPKWPDRVVSLEARLEYVREMSHVCEIAWDYSWWDKYVLPELSRYVEASNELMPELLRFAALSSAEQSQILRLAPMAARRLPRCRAWSALDLNPRDRLDFRRFNSNSQTPDNLERFRRIMQTLAASKFLDLAFRGHFGLLDLQLGTDSIYNLGKTTQEQKDAIIGFFDTLVHLFASRETPFSHPRLLGWFAGMTDDGTTIPQRLQIQELAMQRFAWCTPWDDALVPYCLTWPREAAIDFHRRLSQYSQQVQQDPRLHQNSAHRQEWLTDYFRKQQRKLEEHYDLSADQPGRLPLVDPFARLVLPDLGIDADKDYTIQLIGFDGRFLYLDHQSTPCNTLLSVDTAAGLAVTRKKHANTTGWYGTHHQGVILTDFLVSGNGPFVFLYPKDGSAMQTLDFRAYCKDTCHALAGCGDRLFLAFDGVGNRPGTVLEYNVKTGESKRLVSTLDASVVWPLQGRRKPYQISRLLCDGANQRLLMLMHDLPTARPGERLRFKAYHWETGEWRDVSNPLPIFYNFEPIFLDNGRLWLLSDFGVGPVNGEGDWQPVFLRNSNGHFTEKLPYYAANNSKMTVDLSRLMPPPEKYRHLARSDLFFTSFDHGILFAEKLLMLVPECRIIMLTKRFHVMACFAGKIVVGYPVVQGRREPLHIGILKDRSELLRDAE